MQIANISTSSGLAASGAGSAGALDELLPAADGAPAPARAAAGAGAPTAPLRRGLNNWDHQVQGEISSAQQALDFLDQSTSQLQALKSELAAKLAARQGRDGQVEARLRQFSNTWRTRQRAAGGALDARLAYSSGEPARQRFTIRGLTLASLQSGGKEVLAFAAGGGQALGSVSIEPGLSDQEIVGRFDQALAPLQIKVGIGEAGTLVFSTPESSWAGLRDTLAVKGSGIRFPTGQLNRVKTDEEPALIAPDEWGSSDMEALRHTLQQVVQALAHVQQARDAVSQALAQAAGRVAPQPADDAAGMARVADNFVGATLEPSYEAMLAVTAALTGISRERVLSLLGLR